MFESLCGHHFYLINTARNKRPSGTPKDTKTVNTPRTPPKTWGRCCSIVRSPRQVRLRWRNGVVGLWKSLRKKDQLRQRRGGLHGVDRRRVVGPLTLALVHSNGRIKQHLNLVQILLWCRGYHQFIHDGIPTEVLRFLIITVDQFIGGGSLSLLSTNYKGGPLFWGRQVISAIYNSDRITRGLPGRG